MLIWFLGIFLLSLLFVSLLIRRNSKDTYVSIKKHFKFSFLKLILWIQSNKASTAIVVLCIYGSFLLIWGIRDGIYLTEYSWIQDIFNVKQTKNPINQYDQSFYASASQDFFFFFLVGISITTLFSIAPKDMHIENKINTFFPEIQHNSALMKELIVRFNEHSCITHNATKEVTVKKIDNDFIKLSIHSEFDVINMHNNISIDGEFGDFRLFTDDSIWESKYKSEWGEISRFEIKYDKSEKKERISEVTILDQKKPFKKNYIINLDHDETATVIIIYELWIDIKEELELETSFFTKNYDLIINNAVKDVPLKVKVKRCDRKLANQEITSADKEYEISKFNNKNYQELRVNRDMVKVLFLK
ncbi:hypothetical protein [Thalassotalea castellviae]|uniref:Uncharacterized protein n=1 Tax=Thalassotalea castellviae TaxID=3075612 RepID=A0ABU3A056_9GAMM|nr:hypothetical protein [Thalassotalea sp. W431]MDT0603565.1 hypothetical protein [Thalassotalea sp. W431]